MNMTSKPKPVLVVFAVLAGVKVVAGGAAFVNLVPTSLVELILLLLAGVDVAVAFYLQGQVTPYSNVVAYQPNPIDNPNLVVGGGAASSDLEGTPLSSNVELAYIPKHRAAG